MYVCVYVYILGVCVVCVRACVCMRVCGVCMCIYLWLQNRPSLQQMLLNVTNQGSLVFVINAVTKQG